MLSFSEPAVYQAPKCFVTYGTMAHVDSRQLPSKGKPWVTLLAQEFIHKVDLVLPQDLYDLVLEKVLNARDPPVFTRVIMSLGDILHGEFFKEYIKQGNVTMLSEGRNGVDNTFTLMGGKLKLFLDKETYERAGLVGQPYGAKGKRGLKPRWVIDFDLSSRSMFPGKKGFDRLIYACKNVLNTPMSWLFCNLSSSTPEPNPLADYHPVVYTAKPGVTQGVDHVIPPLESGEELIEADRWDAELLATELYEWLALVRLESPRARVADAIDPYLSRYQVPGEDGQHTNETLCKVSWEGFLSSTWARQTLVDLLQVLPSRSWFAYSVSTFSKGVVGDNSECTILRPPNGPGRYLMWEVKGHE